MLFKYLPTTTALFFLMSSFLQAEDIWSKEVNGLEARLLIIEKPTAQGPRYLIPHLELRNARDFPNAMNELEIDVSKHSLKLEIVDRAGKALPSGFSVRSGPDSALKKVILPYKSFIRINLEGKGWGIGTSLTAVMPSDSEFFSFTEAENGTCYLRVTLENKKGVRNWRAWDGKIDVPQVLVEWNSKRPQQ
jgi:hypothetical protein